MCIEWGIITINRILSGNLCKEWEDQDMKNILFAASECVPFIKTGGLADVVGSLPKDFDKEKYDVRVVIPNYMCMKQEWKEKLEYVTHFY